MRGIWTDFSLRLMTFEVTRSGRKLTVMPLSRVCWIVFWDNRFVLRILSCGNWYFRSNFHEIQLTHLEARVTVIRGGKPPSSQVESFEDGMHLWEKSQIDTQFRTNFAKSLEASKCIIANLWLYLLWVSGRPFKIGLKIDDILQTEGGRDWQPNLI
jgi:hypothetical protein